MRSLFITLIVSSFLAVTAMGCGGDKAAPAAEEKIEASKKAEAPKKADDSKKAEAPKKAEASKKAEAPKKAAAPTDGKASEADCKAACDNVKKLALAELPKELPAEARKAAEAELAKGMATCPAECQKESTGATAKCMAGAKSMEDMMKCEPAK